MRTSPAGSAGGALPMRVIIIDDHEISRAAFCALLLSEGVDVVADLNAGRDALAMARALRPAVVIVDVTPAADAGFAIARRMCALLPAPPVVILTSSTDRTRFGARLNGHLFIAKADICAAAIASLATTPTRTDHNHQIPAPPRTAPSQPATTNAVGQRSGHAQRGTGLQP